MSNLPDFITYLQTQADNGSIYVWGAQGQKASDSLISKRETNIINRTRAKKLLMQRINDGYDPEKILAFDCSGLGMHYLQNIKKFLSCDLNAHGMMGKCAKLDKSALKKGDWVFRVYTAGSKKGRARHIGYVVDDELNVIEARGRKYGVVKRDLGASGAAYWNAFGRPALFKKEIEETEHENVMASAAQLAWSLNRVLKKATPRLSGNEVLSVQKALLQHGFSCGQAGADGIYGTATAAAAAVASFQKANGLYVDGMTGKNTCKALGGEWKGKVRHS
ncbi:MAG: C40 family peptidase [Christensenellales bacterium]